MTEPTLEPIPGPRGVPVLGNVFDLDRTDPLGGFVRMAETYGPIVKMSGPGSTRLIVSGPELVDEVCEDARFDKKIGGDMPKMLDVADQLRDKWGRLNPGEEG